MKRTMTDESRESKRSYMVKQEGVTFAYDPYVGYSTATSTSSTVNPPLPGQPPLPPMPPPPVPPPHHVFVTPQVNPLQTWTHAPPPWQWLAQQQAISSQVRDIATNFPRGNFIKRERFNNTNLPSSNTNRNIIYNQRNNFHRQKRKAQRFDSKLEQTYFDVTSVSPTVQNLTNHYKNENTDINLEDERIKKNKPRKPMSQSYPSRPWNREDAIRALSIESEYNKTVKAQSLIIKFPDPDLNKEIVRDFHPGIQNIHFQSPSGPRYCFIQMADNVNIDEAIIELEKVSFGIGHLKVERKSLRDDDNPMPEEIDPYTLYIGNLPESVNVNEVKSKFTTAARVDVGYAQKMRNTRYAFIRYNSVDESISAYKQAHDLMWDTRSIIVRFRRQRGNTCLPGEQKSVKKVKDESSVKNEEKNKQLKENEKKKTTTTTTSEKEDVIIDNNRDSSTVLTELNTSILELKEKDSEISVSHEETNLINALLTQIKEEPQDYVEINMQNNNDDDDDDDDDEEDDNDVDDEDDDEQDAEIDEDEEINDNEDKDDEDDDDDDDDDDDGRINPPCSDDEIMPMNNKKSEEKNSTDLQPDHLDRIFSDLENIASDISL